MRSMINLGQRDTPEWTLDIELLEASKKFGTAEIENRIMWSNNDKKLGNGRGPVQVPYTVTHFVLPRHRGLLGRE